MHTKRFQISDIVFITSLLAGLAAFFLLLRTMPIVIDETFYPSIALRLINGDSLITDEWHLSQFSSFFLYLPVKLWLAVKGSTDGIIIYMRCAFLLLHSLTACVIYTFFRKHKAWAVAGALAFFLQAPMRIYTLCYNSLLSFFLLMLCILLYAIYHNQNRILYILAGICYGSACICNPFFVIAAFFYCIAYLVLYHLQKPRKIKKNDKNKIKKQYSFSAYPIFFSKDSFLLFYGACAFMLLLLIVFFFATGGTLDGITGHIKNLMTDTEHNIFVNPIITFIQKLWTTLKKYAELSFYLPFVLPALCAGIIVDKKKYDTKHRLPYLFAALVLAIVYAIAVKNINEEPNNSEYFFWSLPFLIVSTVSFLLTKQKNYPLFFCFWIPGCVAAFAQYMASNLHLLALGWVMAVNCVAGVFFIKDLFIELKSEQNDTKKWLRIATQVLLCLFILLNLTWESLILCYDLPRVYTEKTTEMTQGVYEGIFIEKRVYGSHTLLQKDLATIQSRTDENDNVLIISEMCWLQLEIDRPIAAYSAWQLSFEPDRFAAYFEQNPDKKPKYIYVSATLNADYTISFPTAERKASAFRSMFNCTEEKLSRGILLTVIE